MSSQKWEYGQLHLYTPEKFAGDEISFQTPKEGGLWNSPRTFNNKAEALFQLGEEGWEMCGAYVAGLTLSMSEVVKGLQEGKSWPNSLAFMFKRPKQ